MITWGYVFISTSTYMYSDNLAFCNICKLNLNDPICASIFTWTPSLLFHPYVTYLRILVLEFKIHQNDFILRSLIISAKSLFPIRKPYFLIRLYPRVLGCRQATIQPITVTMIDPLLGTWH